MRVARGAHSSAAGLRHNRGPLWFGCWDRIAWRFRVQVALFRPAGGRLGDRFTL